VNTTIQLRRGTAASAASDNPTLAAGEVGVETDSGKFKIGDGQSAWNDLAYATDLSRLPNSVVDTTNSNRGQVPVANGQGGYTWSSGPTPVDNSGFVGATISDTAIIPNANTSWYPNPGTLIMTACQVRASATRLLFEVDEPGSNLTAGQNPLGIYDPDGNLVMEIGDMTSIYQNTADYAPVVVALPSPLAPSLYYVAQLANGGYTSANAPYLAGWRAPMITEIGTLVTSPPRVSYGSAVYTSLPSSVNWKADGFNASPWNFVTFFAFLP
jgi:Major tropism determinant N-terminal domain